MTDPNPWTDGPAFQRAAARRKPLDDIAAERRRQDAKWGEQNHADGTGPGKAPLRAIGRLLDYSMEMAAAPNLADAARLACQDIGLQDTWAAILLEEVFEALAEDDPQRLRVELIQVAAVAAQWAEAIDRRA